MSVSQQFFRGNNLQLSTLLRSPNPLVAHPPPFPFRGSPPVKVVPRTPELGLGKGRKKCLESPSWLSCLGDFSLLLSRYVFIFCVLLPYKGRSSCSPWPSCRNLSLCVYYNILHFFPLPSKQQAFRHLGQFLFPSRALFFYF